MPLCPLITDTQTGDESNCSKAVDKRTDRQTDRLYQVQYFPRFVVDNKII